MLQKTTDGGNTWTSSGNFRGKIEIIQNIYFKDTQNGWVNYGNYRTTDGGTTWVTSGITIQATGMQFLTPQLGWASGTGGHIIKTTDGGTTWIDQGNSGSTEQLNFLYFSDTQNGSTYTYTGKVLKTTDGGANWATYTTNLPPDGGIPYSNLFFTDRLNGWCMLINANQIAHTTDGGLTWNTQTTGGGDGYIVSFSFVDKQTGWALRDRKSLLKTTDGGKNWTNQLLTGLSSSIYINFSNNQQGFIVQSNGDVARTVDGGTSWTSYTHTDPGGAFYQGLLKAQFLDTQNGWAIVNYAATTLYHTTNGGATWTAVDPGISGPQFCSSYGDIACYGIRNFFFLDAQNGWLVGPSGFIMRTSDGGSTWTYQTSGTTKGLYAIHFANLQRGWAVGRGGTILSTTNGGTTWASQSSGVAYDYMNDVKFLDAQNGIIVGSDHYTGGGAAYVLRTSDGGTTWKKEPHYLRNEDLSVVYYKDAETVFLGGGYDQIVKGIPYNPITPPSNAITAGASCAIISVKTGNWNDPTVWLSGRVPIASDAVTVNHIVTITTNFTANAGRVIFGTGGRLVYGTGGRVRLGL